jgi:hypothetical protein
LEIKLLYINGCPNLSPTLKLLKSILKEKDLEEKIELIEIKSQEDVEKHKFLGSPTIQINGLDIEKEKRKSSPVFGCRMYKIGDNYSGIPPKHLIIEAIEES